MTTPRQKILASTGRAGVVQDQCRSAASILAESKALAEFRAFKESL